VAARGRAPFVEPQPRRIWPYIALGGGGLLVLILVAVVPRALASKAPPEVTEWKQEESMTGELSLEVPANWTFTTSGSGSIYENARVQGSKLSRVTIHGSSNKGSLADITGSAASAESGLFGETPQSFGVADRGEGRLHTLIGSITAKEDKHFVDSGVMEETEFRGRPAAYSDYTSLRRAGLLKVKVKGRRLTAPAGDLAYDVRAECPAQHWEQFEPIAWRIIESVEAGGL
jgi:hypothetical protein